MLQYIKKEVKVEFYDTLNNIKNVQIIIIENLERIVELENRRMSCGRNRF